MSARIVARQNEPSSTDATRNDVAREAALLGDVILAWSLHVAEGIAVTREHARENSLRPTTAIRAPAAAGDAPAAPGVTIAPTFDGGQTIVDRYVALTYDNVALSGTTTGVVDSVTVSVTGPDGPIGLSPVSLGAGTWSTVFDTLQDSGALLPTGTYTVAVTAANAAGSTTATEKLLVDEADPTPTIDPVPAYLATRTPVLTGTGEPGSTVTVSASAQPDGATSSVTTVLGTATVAADGTWRLVVGADGVALPTGTGPITFTATGADIGGNPSGTATSGPTTLDQTPPVVALTADAGHDRAPQFITGYVTDNYGLIPATVAIYDGSLLLGTAQVDRADSDATTGGYAFSLPVTLGEGTHRITAQAVDELGNLGVSNTLSFTLDAAPPTLSVDAIGSDGLVLRTELEQGLTLAGTAGGVAPGTAVRLSLQVLTPIVDKNGDYIGDKWETVTYAAGGKSQSIFTASTTDASGDWSATLPAPLAAIVEQIGYGNYRIVADVSNGTVSTGAIGAFYADAAVPHVTIVSGDQGALYAGQTRQFAVTLNAPAFFTGGTPSLSLSDGGVATYVSGVGSQILIFSYTPGDEYGTDVHATGFVLPPGATMTDGYGAPFQTSFDVDLGFGVNTSGAVTVTSSADSGPGSLRAAIAYADAHPRTTIAFAANVDGVTLASALPAITADTFIVGNASAAGGTLISGGGVARPFTVGDGVHPVAVTFQNLDVASGYLAGTSAFDGTYATPIEATPGGAFGAGMFVAASASVTLDSVRLEGNEVDAPGVGAAVGGGLFVAAGGTVSFRGTSSVTENFATGQHGNDAGWRVNGIYEGGTGTPIVSDPGAGQVQEVADLEDDADTFGFTVGTTEAGLVKNGAGRLVLDDPQLHGNIALNAGTLEIAETKANTSAAQTGFGTVVFGSGAATLVVDASAANYAPEIEGFHPGDEIAFFGTPPADFYVNLTYDLENAGYAVSSTPDTDPHSATYGASLFTVAPGNAQDGYLEGATIGFDDGTGGFSTSPFATTATTDANGDFLLTNAYSGFAQDGVPLLLKGGVDTATGLAFTGVLEAPATSRMITPVTTLVQAVLDQGGHAAEDEIAHAYGLPAFDEEKLDAEAGLLAGNAQAGAVFAFGVELEDFAALATASDPALSGLQPYLALAKAVAAGEAAPSLTGEQDLQNVLEALGVSAGPASTAALLASSANEAIQQALAAGKTADATFQAIEGIAAIIQGNAASALKASGTDATSLAAVAGAYSGEKLASLAAARAPFVTIPEPPDESTIPCFARGTRIAVPGGLRAVEHLREGDLVLTSRGEARAIVWVGHRHVDIAAHNAPEKIRPVAIAADAFGPGLPSRSLVLSPDHNVFFEDVLIPAKCLVNGRNVVLCDVAAIDYHHIELAEHDIVLAEDLPVETYLDTGNRSSFAGGKVVDAFPDFGSTPDLNYFTWDAKGAARLAVAGPEVTRARALLAASADRAAAADAAPDPVACAPRALRRSGSRT